mmetsp:Transcript_51608/g.122936  ORF Transcript_51608/g.122936 Transcript_51608/m.122936 type:complete len:271 (-) Transcript_51608:521-1333(-)
MSCSVASSNAATASASPPTSGPISSSPASAYVCCASFIGSSSSPSSSSSSSSSVPSGARCVSPGTIGDGRGNGCSGGSVRRKNPASLHAEARPFLRTRMKNDASGLCPAINAKMSGESLCASLASTHWTEDPTPDLASIRQSSASHASSRPKNAAQCSGVRPYSSNVSGLAPPKMSSSTISTLPWNAASCKGEKRCGCGAETFAPALRSSDASGRSASSTALRSSLSRCASTGALGTYPPRLYARASKKGTEEGSRIAWEMLRDLPVTRR